MAAQMAAQMYLDDEAAAWGLTASRTMAATTAPAPVEMGSIAAAAAAAAAVSHPLPATYPISSSGVVRSWGSVGSQSGFEPRRQSLGTMGDTGGSSSGTNLQKAGQQQLQQQDDFPSTPGGQGRLASCSYSPRGRKGQQPQQPQALPLRSNVAAPPPVALSAALGSSTGRSIDRQGGLGAKPKAGKALASPAQTPRDTKRIQGGRAPKTPAQKSPQSSPRGTSPTASATSSLRTSMAGTPSPTTGLSRSIGSSAAAAAAAAVEATVASPAARLRSPGRSSVASAISSPRSAVEGSLVSPRGKYASRLSARALARQMSHEEQKRPVRGKPGDKGRVQNRQPPGRQTGTSPRGLTGGASALSEGFSPRKQGGVRMALASPVSGSASAGGSAGGESVGAMALRARIGRRPSDGSAQSFLGGFGDLGADAMGSRASSAATSEMADVALYKSTKLLEELAQLTATADEDDTSSMGAANSMGGVNSMPGSAATSRVGGGGGRRQGDALALTMSTKASMKSYRAASPELVKEMAEIKQCLQHIQTRLDGRPRDAAGQPIVTMPMSHPALIRAMPQLIRPPRANSGDGALTQLAMTDKGSGSPIVPIAGVATHPKVKPWSQTSTACLGSSVCEGIASGNSAASSNQRLQHRPGELQIDPAGRHLMCMSPPGGAGAHSIVRKASSEVNLQPVVVTELHRYIAWTAPGRGPGPVATPDEPCARAGGGQYVAWAPPGQRPVGPGSARFTATL